MPRSHGLAAGDVSGDGRPDVALADYNHGLVVLYSEPVAPLPPPPPPPPPPPVADVGVDVTASDSRVRPKKGFWFDVTVTNAGPDRTSASLASQLSGAPTNVSENSSACSLQSLVVTCSLGDLGVGSSTTVRISGTAPNKGTLAVTATVDGAADHPNGANDTDSVSVVVR